MTFQSESEQAHWYAVQVFPRHDKKTAEWLETRNVEQFCPTYKVARRWKNGCRVELDLPLFPGYLFIRIALQNRLKVLQTPGVLRFIAFGKQPVEIADEVIASLQSGLNCCPAEPHPYLKTGDRVRVRSGPFAGLEGILLRKKNGVRVVLSLDLIGQSMAVDLDVADLDLLPLSAQLAMPTAVS